MSNAEIIAKNLKLLRKIHRITQQDLSSKLELNYRHYQSIEAGKVDLKLSTLERLAEFFGVPLQCFFGPALSMDSLELETQKFDHFLVQVLDSDDLAFLKACQTSLEMTGLNSLSGLRPTDFSYPIQEGRKRVETSLEQVVKKTKEKGECHFAWKVCASESGRFCSPSEVDHISHVDVSMVAVEDQGRQVLVAFTPKRFKDTPAPQF